MVFSWHSAEVGVGFIVILGYFDVSKAHVWLASLCFTSVHDFRSLWSFSLYSVYNYIPIILKFVIISVLIVFTTMMSLHIYADGTKFYGATTGHV